MGIAEVILQSKGINPFQAYIDARDYALRNKMNNLSLQQEQIKQQQLQSEFNQKKDYNDRMNQYKAAVQEMYQSGNIDENALAQLRMKLFAPEIARQQIENPLEAERVRQRDVELGIRSENALLNREKSQALQKHRDRMYDFQNKKYDSALIDANRRYGLAVEKFNFDKSGGSELVKRTIEDSELLQEITPELQQYKKQNQY